jgi:hypothetical protein
MTTGEFIYLSMLLNIVLFIKYLQYRPKNK